MMKIIRLFAALLALGSPAAAQVVQLQPGAVLGNSTAARALAQPASMSAMLNRSITGGTTQGALLTRNATDWVALAPGLAGLPLISGGAAANLGYGIASLAGGGTAAALTASNGGIFYSTATAGAILAGTATARQMLQSGSSTTPAWSTTTWPATTTINRLLWSSAANVISDLATTNGGILNAGATGVPAMTTTPVLGLAGTLGTLGFGNATSGTITLQPVAGALGSAVLTMPAATDTLAVLAASQAFTNKTYNGNTWTAGTGTLTIAAGKTLTANSSLTLAGTDAKTLTVSNSLTLAGTDATTMTFPTVSATIPRTVASGAKALATGAITSATCTTAQTDTATGTLTTDAVSVSFSADPTATTGYVPLTTGMLTIIFYPTADTVNFKVCNNTSASITPGAVTINWRVIR